MSSLSDLMGSAPAWSQAHYRDAGGVRAIVTRMTDGERTDGERTDGERGEARYWLNLIAIAGDGAGDPAGDGDDRPMGNYGPRAVGDLLPLLVMAAIPAERGWTAGAPAASGRERAI